MEGYDIIMLVLVIASTLYGAHKGLAWQIASIASIFASYGAAYRYRGEIAAMLPAEAPWNMFLAMLILYVGSSLGIWLLFRLLKDFIERMKLKEFDSHMGAVFGLAKGAILCSLVTLFAVTLLGDTQRRAIVRARSGHYIASLLHRADPIMPSEVKDLLGPYLETLEHRLETEGDLLAETDDASADGDESSDSDRRSDSANRSPLGELISGVLDSGDPDSTSDSGRESAGRPERGILNNMRRWSDRFGDKDPRP